jgi:hypothetical protein
MVGEHVTVAGRRRHLAFKTLDMRYESFTTETPEAWPVIDYVLTAFVSIITLCDVSSRVKVRTTIGYKSWKRWKKLGEMPGSIFMERSCSRCCSSATLAFSCGC